MKLLRRLWCLIVGIFLVCYIGTIILPAIVFLAKGTIYVNEIGEYMEDLSY